MRAPDWASKLGKPPCGCEQRKFIMWEAGNTGLWQALAMAAAAGFVIYIAARK